MRIALVASRVYEPERVPTRLARPQVLVFMRLRLIGPSEYFMYIRRPARRALLLRVSRDLVWNGYFPLVTGFQAGQPSGDSPRNRVTMRRTAS